MRLTSLAPLAVLVLAACAGSPGGEGAGGVNLRAQPGASSAWQGDLSAASERLETVARTSEEWRALWAKAGTPAPDSLPGGSMAVAIFLGPRAGGGHAVFLEAPVASDSGIAIPYRETVPGPADPVGPNPTAPFAIRIVDAKPGPVSFMLAK